MATYTELNRPLIERILAEYDVGPLLRYELLSGGKANSSVVVSTATGQFVLSVCDEKSAGETDSLTSILQYLADHNFPTTRIVQTVSGNSWMLLGNKPVYLKKHIPGSVENDLSESTAYQVGGVLARLHGLPLCPRLPRKFAYGVETFAEILDANITDEYIGWLRQKRDAIEKGCPANLPRGFIHGDLFLDNILFSNGRLVAVLDFEEACTSFLLFDLGMCAAGCCTVDGRFSLDLAAALIRGYQSIRQLQSFEKQLFQLHIEYGAVATSFWRYRQFNLRYPEAGHPTLYKEMTDLADEVHGISQEVFLRSIFG
ncbi:MAG: homoserine kinase [Desulforhopalus sp.]